MINKYNPAVVWVEDANTFAQLANSWLACDYLAIDTEFERRTTYYPILALVQVYDGEKVYLIDPLKVDCPSDFRLLCENENITKIMHSAREDLEVFYYSWGCQLKGLFDTQIAHAFVSGEMSKGYAALVESICGNTLDKQATQSDWMLRPLSDKQLDYAAKDVIYLPELYNQLKEQLKEQPYFNLYQYECDELCLLVTKLPDYNYDYRTAKDVWRLNQTELCLFKKLYQWREETAIKENRTKNHILRDPQLVQVASQMPQSKTALQKIEDFHPRSFRLYHQAIIELVEAFKVAPEKEVRRIPNPRDLVNLNRLSDMFLGIVKAKATQQGIASGLLASKRLVKKIAFAKLTDEPFPAVWDGWRGELLKSELNRIEL